MASAHLETDMDAQPASTRERIVGAGFHLFIEYGYEGTGLSAILKETGLSKGAFYHHFPTKEDLFKEVVTVFFLRPMRNFDIDTLRQSPLRDARDLLGVAYEQLPRAAQNAGVDMTRYFALFFESLSRLPEFRDEVRKYYSDLLEVLALKTYEEREVTPRIAVNNARNLIGSFEGRLLLSAIFGHQGPPAFEPATKDAAE